MGRAGPRAGAADRAAPHAGGRREYSAPRSSKRRDLRGCSALAHTDLLALRFDLFPYEPFAPRVWELRDNLTAHDAWYVALAEALSAKLATLDSALCRASGPRCGFLTPESRTS